VLRGAFVPSVEMEAAALYAFARARGAAVLCFAHVTNRMAQVEGDFEKGEADGVEDAGLEKMGYLTRTRDPSDKRQVRVRPTKLGAGLRARARDILGGIRSFGRSIAPAAGPHLSRS
jgi:hypothetical protein